MCLPLVLASQVLAEERPEQQAMRQEDPVPDLGTPSSLQAQRRLRGKHDGSLSLGQTSGNKAEFWIMRGTEVFETGNIPYSPKGTAIPPQHRGNTSNAN